MSKPVVGIIGNRALLEKDYPVHVGGTMDSEAVALVCHALPVIVPADPRLVSIPDLLEICDGFILTGAEPNVHPEEYGEEATAAHGMFDRAARQPAARRPQRSARPRANPAPRAARQETPPPSRQRKRR